MATQEIIRVDTAPRASDGVAASRTGVIVLPWERLALGAVLLLAAILDVWQLDRIGYGNTYYAAAVRSMLTSWHAFFFNAFDAGGFVSIDKPPLGFWLQVGSAKLFGYSGLSLMLPQALAGVLSVAVLYRLVARTFGHVAGLLAALALAVMPVNVAANRNNIIDSTLVLALLLGAWAVLRAAETGRLRWLALCGVLVGLGFNIKMLEAYLVIPAFGVLYLLAAPIRWTTRVWRLVAATLVLLAVSFSWAVAVDATPASQRPYVGSSGTNSEVTLALGYNGLERLTGRIFFGGRGTPARATTPAARDRSATGTAGSATGTAGSATGTGAGTAAQRATAGGFTRGESGSPSPLRLFNSALGGQVSWLLPLALLGLVAAAWRTRLRIRPRLTLDRRQQSLVLWGAWLFTGAAFFSVAGFFHTYYMVTLAPSIAALAGIGVVALWRNYRDTGWRGWALPVVLLMTAAVQAYMLSAYPDWARWLTPLVVGLCLVAAATLVLVRLGVRLGLRAGLAAAALGVVGLLAAPAVWAADTVATSNSGGTPTAGPRPQDGAGGFPSVVTRSGRDAGASARYGGRGGSFGGGDGASANTALIRYVEAHQGNDRYLLATLNSMSAAPIIIATGKPVMALGGFSGADRIVTPSGLATFVSNGTVRYVMLNGGFGGFGGARSFNLDDLPPQVRAFMEGQGRRSDRGGFGDFGGGNADLSQWVTQHCAAVPSSLWQNTSTPSTNGGVGGRGGAGQLYDCASHPTATGTAGAASPSPGFGSAGTAPVLTPSGAAPSTALPALSGQWVAGAVGTVTVQSFQEQQSLPTTTGTHYYRVTTAAGDVAVGQRVAITASRAATSTAGSVTIGAAGAPDISVRLFGVGGFGGAGSNGNGGAGSNGNGGAGSGSGGFGGPGSGNAGGSGGSGGVGGNGGAGGVGGYGGSGRRGGVGGARRGAITGTVTAIQSGSITVKTAAGAARTLTSSTAVYQVIPATRGQFQSGLFVAVGSATVGGQRVATDVVQSAVAGAIPTFVPASPATNSGASTSTGTNS